MNAILHRFAFTEPDAVEVHESLARVWASAQEALDEDIARQHVLARFREAEGLDAGPAPPPSRARRGMGAALVAVLLALIGGAVVLYVLWALVVGLPAAAASARLTVEAMSCGAC